MQPAVIAILPSTLQHTKPAPINLVNVFLFFFRAVCWFCTVRQYAIEVCTVHYYAKLLFFFSGVWHARIYSVCCVSVQRSWMLMGMWFVFLTMTILLGLASHIHYNLHIFRTNCISYVRWKWLDIQCLCVVIKFSFSNRCRYVCCCGVVQTTISIAQCVCSCYHDYI